MPMFILGFIIGGMSAVIAVQFLKKYQIVEKKEGKDSNE